MESTSKGLLLYSFNAKYRSHTVKLCYSSISKSYANKMTKQEHPETISSLIPSKLILNPSDLTKRINENDPNDMN